MTTNILKILKKRRVEANISQQTIAKALGIPQASYSRIETGKYQLTFNAFLIICDVIDAEPTKILKEMEISEYHD